MKTKFYVCPICGNVIMKVVNGGPIPVCCGQSMQTILPNLTAGKGESHIPQVSRVGDCGYHVEVGQEPHPMRIEHLIRFIFLETEHGGQIRFFMPGDAPAACFYCGTDKPLSVYEYCNMHGLWMNSSLPHLPCEHVSSVFPGCPMD